MKRTLVVLPLVASLFVGCQSSGPKKEAFRRPADARELVMGSRTILNELTNPQVFNASTCAAYVNKVTDYLFALPGHHFIPKTPGEVDELKTHGEETIDTIFQIRVTLGEKLKEFDARNELTTECQQKIREGFQYSRFAEEYLLEWLFANKNYEFKKTPIMANSKPNTWTNPKYANYDLKTGDVMLIRGKSYVSAMIARISDEEANFSHLAIIGEDKTGKKYVVEALIQHGVIVTPLEKWRDQEDARVALYRQKDAALGQLAGRKMYETAKAALDKGSAIPYDFAMEDKDHSAVFCSEVVSWAYEMASDNSYIIPKFRSSISKFKNSNYPRSLGLLSSTLFSPHDIEVDPRFELVAEYRFYPLLRQVRMQDTVLQSIYSWIIEKNYEFYWSPTHSVKTFLGKFIRQFGFMGDKLPKYMPMSTLKTTLQFENVANALEENIYAKEKAFYQAKGYLPSPAEMLQWHEEYRRADCALGPNSKFHYYFHTKSNSCE
ncbi:MAG: hypothetical protein HUU57_11185 [Bdellovibrio sp.]|nr:hypothetical protein [Bdellovibrio sp.]